MTLFPSWNIILELFARSLIEEAMVSDLIQGAAPASA